MDLPRAPRILIARMSAIGDTILTLPVLCALRERFPKAYLAWIVEAPSAPVVRDHQDLDELIVLPRRWFKSPRRIVQLRRDLHARRFDATIDCQSITKTALACRLSGAPARIGAGDKNARELSGWMNNHLVTMRTPHLVDRTLELLEPLGVETPEVRFRLPIGVEASANMKRACDQFGLDGAYAAINPGASWDSKLWPAERFAAVARHLGDRHGLPSIVVWAGERELQWARTIVARSDGRAVLAPQTSLVELAALLRGARLFVSADTGPLHMAAAVGATSVGLYGVTRPADCGPYGANHVALQAYYQGGSHRQRRRAANDAMRAITIDHVCLTCDRLIARDTARRSAEAA